MKLGDHLLIDIICDNYDILNSLEKLEELSDKLIKICKLTKHASGGIFYCVISGLHFVRTGVQKCYYLIMYTDLVFVSHKMEYL